ncbi:MAG: FAD-dependent oxidoreductase, partial [Bacteroidetes bacterium]
MKPMKRDLKALCDRTFDVIVVGGGITGVHVARDAALRGLRVALLEAGDFGSATSSNSLRTVHGGLRYLQDANLRLVRMMVRERRALFRIAPHLVYPLPVLMPTYRDELRYRKPVLGAAVRLNDLLSFDRNRGVVPSRHLPGGRILSRGDVLRLLPGLEASGLTGAVCWYDGQVYDTERLLLSVLGSAVQRGAVVANYVRVTGLLRRGEQVTGVEAVDTETGAPLSIAGRVVVNAAGPWVDEVIGSTRPARRPRFLRSVAMNLVTRQVVPEVAIGLRSRVAWPGGGPCREQVLFVAPWKSCSLIGTLHFSAEGRSDHPRVT